MSKENTSMKSFQDVVDGLSCMSQRINKLLESIKQDAEEIENLNDDIDELRSDAAGDADEIEKLNSIIDELRDEVEVRKSANREMSEALMRYEKGGEA